MPRMRGMPDARPVVCCARAIGGTAHAITRAHTATKAANRANHGILVTTRW
jgi:hypothetical protein